MAFKWQSNIFYVIYVLIHIKYLNKCYFQVEGFYYIWHITRRLLLKYVLIVYSNSQCFQVFITYAQRWIYNILSYRHLSFLFYSDLFTQVTFTTAFKIFKNKVLNAIQIYLCVTAWVSTENSFLKLFPFAKNNIF